MTEPAMAARPITVRVTVTLTALVRPEAGGRTAGPAHGNSGPRPGTRRSIMRDAGLTGAEPRHDRPGRRGAAGGPSWYHVGGRPGAGSPPPPEAVP